jgi:hypothetical protein
MNITIDWQLPIQLTRHKKIILDPRDIADLIEARPGVYFFSRKFGSNFVPFYIGETLSIQHRLKSHLKSAQIADVLRGISGDKDIKMGTRHFHFGYLRGNFQKEGAKKRIEIVQRHIIKTALEWDFPILNSSLTKIRTHSLQFNGSPKARAYFAKAMTVEAKAGL